MIAYLAMLEDLRAKVISKIKAVKTLDEVKSNTALTSAYDASSGAGFIKSDRM